MCRMGDLKTGAKLLTQRSSVDLRDGCIIEADILHELPSDASGN